MYEPLPSPEQSYESDDDELDDVGWELCCSAREASIGYPLCPSLDFVVLGKHMAEHSSTDGVPWHHSVR